MPRRRPRRPVRVLFAACLAALALAAAVATGGPAAAAEVRVFAAASTATALAELAAAYAARTGDRIVAVHAASSTLAKQIAHGAPADLFLSANVGWVDYLAKGNATAAATRRPLLANRLVLVAPADTAWTLDLAPGADLAGALGDGRLAMGDPDHVPAGIYGRRALRALGLWAAVRARTAPMTDVRAALALVERGEAAAGVVYATDARVTPRVRVVAYFPADSHPPILYPAALVADEPAPAARAFFAYLFSDEAAAVFARHGFAKP
ncbi:MAG: molybdate ABC transporter substrate-binding protein [Hyphomicrobiales bacterium]|nr:molybdate ABC transporter substrate-binding protein [Hyphomicrobiales bacterium]